jgi:hypothetical protein
MQKTESLLRSREANNERSSLFQGTSNASSQVNPELKKRLTLVGSHFELVSSGEGECVDTLEDFGRREIARDVGRVGGG